MIVLLYSLILLSELLGGCWTIYHKARIMNCRLKDRTESMASWLVLYRYVSEQKTCLKRGHYNARKLNVLSELWSSQLQIHNLIEGARAYIFDVQFLTGWFAFINTIDSLLFANILLGFYMDVC